MKTPADIQAALERVGYIADSGLATALAMMRLLGRPLLVEGEAGVGKTELAKALADASGRRLIRLQCYEGLDASSAVYEWNYQRQILAIRVLEGEAASTEAKESHIFSESFLLKRPLLEAITQAEPPVLLIDEIDRADEEFEAYLLEVLADYQITIPEFGTIRATSIPQVDPDVQCHPRAVRGAAPPLPLSLCRVSGRRDRAADHRGALSRHIRGPRRPDRAVRAAPSRRGSAQEARRRRDAGLGGGARRPRHHGAPGQSRNHSPDAALPLEDQGRPRGDPVAGFRAARRNGGVRKGESNESLSSSSAEHPLPLGEGGGEGLQTIDQGHPLTLSLSPRERGRALLLGIASA